MLRRIERRFKPDIIIVNTILGYRLVAALKAVLPSIPVFWHIHESERAHYFRILKELSPDIFTYPEKVVFVCNATKKVYENMNTGNFCTIYNGIDAEAFNPKNLPLNKNELRRKWNVPEDATIATCIGTITPRKGQKELIEAGIDFLRQSPQSNIHFFMVGNEYQSRSKYLGDALALAKHYSIQDHFHVHPETTEIAEIYALSDIFVCNSFIESFPLVTLEAMVAGLPVIATNIYGIPEQIQHEETGLLILPGNKRMLKEAIERLIQDKDLAKQLGKNAQQHVRAHFTEEKMCKQYEDLMKEAVKEYSVLTPP